MKFFTFLSANKMFVHYLTVVIVLIGIMCVASMKREARPNVNFNRITITAAYPGASPGDVEELVIDPIEEKIAEVDGVEEYRSVSFSGAGSISVKIDDEYPDPQSVMDEVRRKVGEVKDFPEGVDDPVVNEVKAINIPVLRLAIYGKLSPFEMKLEVEKLKDFLQGIPEVQSAAYLGLEDLQLKVLASPDKLDIADLTLIELINSLQSWSRQRPGGLLDSTKMTANISVGLDYKEVDQLEKFVIRANDVGRSVQVRDVADVSYAIENIQQSYNYAGEPAILMTIVKKPFADIISTVDKIKLKLTEYKKDLDPRLSYKLYTDESIRVRNRLNIVFSNAAFGLILVLVILIFALDWRSAAISSIGIPVAILGGLAVIYFTGSSMNSLVIVGMIVVLGMLVDDAIVVCENIYARVEAGDPPKIAAIKGVSEIAVPVLATVLTTFFAFFPILFMKEVIGQFISVIPMTVISMLSVSVLEALVILPIHCEELLVVREKKRSRFEWLEEKYRRYLRWSLRNRWVVLGVTLLVLTGSMLEGRELFKRFTLFPAVGLEGLTVRVETKKNVPLEYTEKHVQALSQAVEAVSDGTFDSIYSNVGQVTTGGAAGSRQVGSHLGAISIVFTTDPEFIHKERSILKAIESVAKEYSAKNGVKTSITIDRPGPPVGKPVQLEITSRDLNFGEQISNQIKSELAKISGIHSIETDLDGDVVKYRFLVDNALAVSEGVNPLDISRTIFAGSTGRVANEILKNNEKVEILVGIPADDESFSIQSLLQLRLRNNSGRSVPLQSYVKLVEEKGPSSIQRLNGLRTITVFAEVDESVITGKEANAKIAPFLDELQKANPSISIQTGGGEKDRLNAVADTMRLYGLAIVLIFMTISLSFRSLIYPILVLLSIPMGICGVVLALIVHGQSFSLMAMIGVVGLSGVVVNVSIILLSYIRERIREGKTLPEAIELAGVRRLRPIIITTLTTLIGLVPTIYGVGGVDYFVQPLALVLGWGLFVATILTIFALPAIISFVTRLERQEFHDSLS